MEKFLEAYREYTREAEPPHNFHAWTAVSVISALLGRKCFIPMGYFTVYPQLYVVLVGTPGSRKSSAMNIGKKLLKTIDGFPLTAESITRESLLDTMQEGKTEYTLLGKPLHYYQATAFVTELSEFLGGRHINRQTVSAMTALWDEPNFSARTRNAGKVELVSPYFTLLGCCAPGWIINSLKEDIISDGFSRRTIFVYEKDRSCFNDWPETTEASTRAWNSMKREIKRIQALKGEFAFTKKAREVWRDFYYDLQKMIDKQPARLQSYYSSKHDLVLKLCMCLSAAYDNSMIVDSPLLKLSIKFFHETEKTLEQVFSGMGRNELKQYHDKLLAFISKTPTGVSRRDVVREFANDLSLREVEETLQVLVETGQVKSESRSVHEPPVLRAVAEVKPTQGLSLLELACQLVRAPEETVVGSSSVATPPDDSGRSQLETLQERWRRATASGRIPLGKLGRLLE